VGVEKGAFGARGEEAGVSIIRVRFRRELELLAMPGVEEVMPPVGSGSDSDAPPAPGVAAMLAQINALPQVCESLIADQVFIRGMRLFNTLPMWDRGSYRGCRFTDRALAQVAPLIAGRPVMVNHEIGAPGIDGLPSGRFFSADMSGTEVLAWFYMVKDAQTEIIDGRIRGGVISEVSPTVYVGDSVCSICGAPEMYYECDNGHRVLEQYDGQTCYTLFDSVSEFEEGSLCWAGQQTNTGFVLPAGRGGEVPDFDVLVRERMGRTRTPLGAWEFMEARPEDWSSFVSS
jgi:hypothetical protein